MVSWNDAQVFLPASMPSNRPRVDYPTAGNMFSPRKPSGSMPAGQARPRRTRGAMILIPPELIITGTEEGLQVMILNKPVMWVSMPPTRGAFLTCTEMSGNGSATGKRTILPVPRPILRVRRRARIRVKTGWFLGRRRDGAAFCFGSAYPRSPLLLGFRVGFQASPADTANPELELFGGSTAVA